MNAGHETTRRPEISSAGNDAPVLVGLVGAFEGRCLSLSRPHLVLGRDPTKCDLVLDHALISREHAGFETDDSGRITIIDLGSANGTFVNGVRVERKCLGEGDTVGVGPAGVFKFQFRSRPRSTVDRPPPATAGEFSVEVVRARIREAGEAATRMATLTGGPAPLPSAAEANPPVLRVGRAPDNDIVLDSPGVSRHHASIRFDEGGHSVLTDTGSTNGTFVNGELVRGMRRVTPSDLVFLGGFLLRVDGRNVTKYDLGSSRIIASGISKDFSGRRVLQDISFAILPREFVGLMGPSGCGKSTLMDALNGLRPASQGRVYVNELDLYSNFHAIQRSIGYVPQRDILHDALSVERTLHYAARLRLPEQAEEQEMLGVIDEVIDVVGLQEQRSTPFRQLSGGQQKRLSLALELLTKPSFLFLDEPTSPLDPETSENLMLLFRKLSDEGRIVVMVTHKFEMFDKMHQIALLTKGGRLAYFGPPLEALRYFNCKDPGQIYRQMSAKDPEEVSREFCASKEYQQYIASRLIESQQAIDAAQSIAGMTTNESRAPQPRAGVRQWSILTQRYLEIKLKDRRNTALLIAQAPVIAFILSLLAKEANDVKTLSIAAIIAIWFGAGNAIREVVSEIPIYRRERLVNLKITSYLLSKFAVLGGIAVIQCALLLVTLIARGRLRAGDLPGLLITISLTAFSGIGLGLLISAIVNSTEKAMSILPLILIPQLLLSGFMVPIEDVYRHHADGKPATVAEYRAFDNVKGQLAGAAAIGARSDVDVIERTSGLGAAHYAADLMAARWSVDALASGVSRTDTNARHVLPAMLTVPAYERVQAGAPEAEIEAAYDRRVWIDWSVLIAMAALCLLGAGWALRSKDSL